LNVLSFTASTPERAMQEVMLRTSLARALMAVHGYTREVEEAYSRALELFEGQRELPQLFPVLRGLASFYNYRAEFEKGRPGGARDPAPSGGSGRSDYPRRRTFGAGLQYRVARRSPWRSGPPRKAIASFESQGYRSRRFGLGNNPGVACFTTSALVLWMLGHPDRALERANRAVALATELGHPFTLAYALFHSGFLHLWRREPELVRTRATGVLNVADEHELQIWTALGTCLLGAANTGVGRFEEGLAQLRLGLDLYQGLKTPPVFWPLLLSVQAGAYARSGRPADGLGFIEEAIVIAGSGMPLLPEFYLLKGDLLLALSDANGDSADPWFQKAFDAAQRLDARMSQLRAAIRLCRLWRDQGNEEQGGRVLRAIYETFTEGFATLDLIEARTLLESQA
jgi:hypothetical protein